MWTALSLAGVFEHNGFSLDEYRDLAYRGDKVFISCFMANTPLELWAQWFGGLGSDDGEFLAEKGLDTEAEEKPRIALFVLALVKKVHHAVSTMPPLVRALDRQDGLLPDLVNLCGSYLEERVYDDYENEVKVLLPRC